MKGDAHRMTLSTSTWLTYRTPGDDMLPIEQTLDLLKAAGFTHVDANFWHLSQRGCPLSADGWQAWVERTRSHADALGLTFYQAHGQTLSGGQWDDPAYAERDFVWAMNYRCIEAAARLGAKWLVMHPFNLPHDPLYSRKKALEANLAYLAPYIEAAKRAGIGLAIENMVDFGGRRRRYCGGDPEELIELVDTIHDPAVGICIDTGHAHVSGLQPGAFIRMAGDRIKATHIDDNRRDTDAHLPPFMGSIDWADTVRALREVGYTGDFAFEIGAFCCPKPARATWCRYIYELGEDLLRMA